MNLALIDPNASVSYVSGWSKNKPIFTTLPDSARVCQVVGEGEEFPIAPPLNWVPCDDNVVADQWYFNASSRQFAEVPPPAPPVVDGIEQL
jgi:hypothetical protein